MTEPERADTTPYGDVAYADPGYQADKKKRYPIDTADHVRAAWAYINKAENAGQYTAQQLASIKSRIMAAAKRLGVQIEDGGRAESPRRDFSRTWDAADIQIRADGDGRTVQAYITPFDAPTEIRDRDGWYDETIGRTAFDKTLQERGLNFIVLFNHGRTYDGLTDGSLMVPIGAPRMIQPQDRGLYSETEYLDNPLADSVLDAVKKGAIRGYSFSGTFMKSQVGKRPSRSAKGAIHRSEVAMREYGPVLFPAYADASILGARAKTFLDELSTLDPEDVDRLRHMLGVATDLQPATPDGTPLGAAVTADDPTHGQSAQQSTDNIRALIRSRNRRREIA